MVGSKCDLGYKCNVCGKFYRHKGVDSSRAYMTLRRHVIRSHMKKQILCSKCGKTFALRDDFEEHLKIHANVGAYTCDLCQKTFKWRAQIIEHMEVKQ